MVQRRPAKGKDKNGHVRFIARWYDHDGKQRSKAFSSSKYARPLEAAKEYEAKMLADMRTGAYVSPEDRRVTVRQAVDAWLARPVRERTAESRHLFSQNLGYLEHMPIAEVKVSHVQTWVNQLAQGRPWRDGKPVSMGTVTTFLVKLRSVFKIAQADGITPFNPAQFVSAPRKQSGTVEDYELPTIRQVKDLIAYLEVRKPDLGLACLIAAETGARASEVAGIQIGDVDRVQGVLRIRRQFFNHAEGYRPLKSESSRRDVPISDNLASVIYPMLDECEGDVNTQMLSLVKGRLVCGNTVMKGLGKYAPEWWPEGVTFHSLRHLFASVLLARGVPLVDVSRFLGHSNVAVTASVYAHFIPREQMGFKSILGE